ncbi:hypothetical protein [Shewanella sp. Isolate11]|uniref:hypothetical protein n=1 Tax=Shewanella sp. Isolate11 TaxID=2908530 RepID=UPI001EFC940F|nr:hypothetical protein [Shewanella sp. Isolate11]MCG9696352.1 hypothetical protein [Shewanella sp. Isolate11]
MLTKLLITLLIIAGALFYIRKPKVESRRETATQQGQRLLFKYIAMAIVALALLGSGGYWYWSWQSGNEIVNVTIVSPNDGNSNIYRVHKRDIGINEITTVDGIKVRLSNQERVVIAPALSQ